MHLSSHLLLIFSEHHKDARPKTRDHTSIETQTQPFPLDRSHTFPYSLQPSQNFYGHAFGATPFMPYPGGHLGFSNPLLNSTSLYQQNPSSFRPMSAPVLNSSLNTSRLEIPQIAASLSSPLHSSFGASPGASPIKSESQGLNGGNASAKSDSGIGLSSVNISPTRNSVLSQQGGMTGSTAGVAGTSLLPDPFMLPMSPRMPLEVGYGAEHNRQMASLLSELDAQRVECKKVSKTKSSLLNSK